MATLASIATGNWTSTSTWGVCDTTSRHTEAATTATTTSYVGATNTTPGAITISGIILKLNGRLATGTFSVELWNATDSVQVTGSEVTVNVTDLPYQGCIYMKFAGNITLEAAHNYYPRIKSSTNATVTVYRSSTASEWDFWYVTTTTQAPAAGDKLIVVGELTGAGTGNDITVTMNETASTDYGTGSTTLASLMVGKRGILTWGSTAATAYYLKLSGIMEIAGGTCTIGNETSDSTSELVFDCGSNVDFGIRLYADGTLNTLGVSKTCVTTLSGNTVISDSYFNVGTTDGWVVGDEIVFAPTSRTYSEFEKHTISSIDSTTEGTVTGIFAYVHSGTSPTAGGVINLTRSTKIHGASGSLQAYIIASNSTNNNAISNFSNTEFYWLGSATTNKRGVELADSASAGSITVTGCSFHDYTVASSQGLSITGSAHNNVSLSSNVMHNIYGTGLNIVATTQTTLSVNGLYIIGNSTSGGVGVNCSDAGYSFNDIYIAGLNNNGFVVGEPGVSINYINAVTSHSNANSGIHINGPMLGTIYSLTCWRNGTYGLQVSDTAKVTFDNVLSFGNSSPNIMLYQRNIGLKIIGATLAGDSSFASATGAQLYTGNSSDEVIFENCTFGVASGIYVAHSTRDIIFANDSYGRVVLRGCTLASTTEVSSLTSLANSDAYIASAKHDNTTGLHKWFMKDGNAVLDTTIYNTASPSLRLTPNILSGTDPDMKSFYGPAEIGGNGRFSVAVASGQTVTVSCYVRGSSVGDGVVYNGQYPKLYVERNYVAGIGTTELDQATASCIGAWEKIEGTTATVTDDCILHFYVNCGGAGYSTGWVNVDDWSATVTDRKGNKYWFDGAPSPVGDNTAGSTSTGSGWFAGE